MNAIARGPKIDPPPIERQMVARDRQVDNGYSKDAQLMAINNARSYRGDRLIRVAKPHRILDPAHGPLVAVRLNICTRKTLGGLETNLDSQVIDPTGRRSRGCTPRARSPASVVAACTATTHSRAPSSAAASSRAAPPGGHSAGSSREPPPDRGRPEP